MSLTILKMTPTSRLLICPVDKKVQAIDLKIFNLFPSQFALCNLAFNLPTGINPGVSLYASYSIG